MITARRSVAPDESKPNLRYAILDGARLVTQHGKLERARTVAEPALVQVARIPEHLGGGYLFWNQRALYRAQTFTGELVGLTDLGTRPTRLAFGPSFALLATERGFYSIDPKTGADKPSGISGLVDVASLADGRSVALTSVGDALVSRDAGRRWTSVRERLAAPVRELREQDGDLWIIERAGEALRYAESGQLTRHPEPKRPSTPVHSDRRWTLPLTPLEAAADSGLRQDDGHALLALNGAVVSIDLESGQLMSFSRALLPSASECRLLRTGELVMFCAQPRPAIVRDPLGGAVIERPFQPGTPAAFADGVFVFGAGCDGELGPGRVCVRGLAGEYQAFDRKKELEALLEGSATPGKTADFAVDWLPKRGGGALGVVSRPRAALVDAASGHVVPIPKERASEWLSALEPRDRKRLASFRVATADGKIIGYGRERNFVVEADGQLSGGAFEFSSLESFGSRALAVDRSQRYFESSDYGLTWSEVEKAPGLGAPQGCSEVGCRSDGWLRFGWGPVPPAAPVPPRVVPAPTLREAAPLPRLDCQEQQAPNLSSQRLSQPGTQETAFDFGFGARQLLMSQGAATHYRQLSSSPGDSGLGLWALVYARVPAIVDSSSGPVPASTAELARQKTIHFVQPFDPRARVSSSKLAWKDQAAAAIRSGGAFPNLQVSDEEQQQALPVAAAPPLYSNGLLLKEDLGPAIWLGGPQPRAISLGQGREDFELRDAVSPRKGDLYLLLVDGDGQSQVISVGAKQLRKTFEFPASASALAVGSSGEPALFFNAVGTDPPSEQEPALMVRSAAELLKLPAWSTLKLANAPECATGAGDYRVLIRAPQAWLELAFASNRLSTSDVDGEMLALVRVDAARFCLEAVELAAPEVVSGDFTIPTRVVARFAGERSAARVGITLGAEFRQSLTCELRASP